MRVVLVEWTKNILELAWLGWEQVKGNVPMNPEVSKVREELGPNAEEILQKHFKKMLTEFAPILEWPTFIFEFDGVSRAFCAQIERARIGVSFFEKSLMTFKVEGFSHRGEYTNPYKPGSNCDKIFKKAMETSDWYYQALLSEGSSIDDARGALPLNVNTRLFMSISLLSLSRMMSNRTCWSTINYSWGIVLSQMRDEIESKVGKFLGFLFLPPCLQRGDCICHKVMEERASLEMPGKVCPIWTDWKETGTYKMVRAFKEGIEKGDQLG